MITAVGGNGGYPGGKQFVSADELREKLSHLRREKALIVKLVRIEEIFRMKLLFSILLTKKSSTCCNGLMHFMSQVDIVDFNGSFLARVRDLVGANPIILVITKVRFYNLVTFSIIFNFSLINNCVLYC